MLRVRANFFLMAKPKLMGLLSACVATIALLGVVSPANAAANPTAATPAHFNGAVGAVDPRPSTAELTKRLRKLSRQSRGAVRVTEIGRSNQNRPVWSARVGYGPLRILYITQQHGNEPLGTPAALEFLRHTGVGNAPYQRWLRSQVTVDVVVRANPDGHEHNWRYNYDPGADPEYGERGKGYDLNRYHDPALAPEDNPATESAFIQRHYERFQPRLVVDYHMQGRYVDDEGDEITASVMWPTHPDVDAEDVALAKQATVVAHDAMTAGGANVTRYPGGDYQGIARNAYGLRGSGSVLVELSNMGAEHERFQIESALRAMLGIAHGAAGGSLYEVDPGQAELLPPRGEPLPQATHATVVSD